MKNYVEQIDRDPFGYEAMQRSLIESMVQLESVRDMIGEEQFKIIENQVHKAYERLGKRQKRVLDNVKGRGK